MHKETVSMTPQHPRCDLCVCVCACSPDWCVLMARCHFSTFSCLPLCPQNHKQDLHLCYADENFFSSVSAIRRLSIPCFQTKPEACSSMWFYFKSFLIPCFLAAAVCGFCILFDPPKTYIFNLCYRLCGREGWVGVCHRCDS